MITGDQFRQAQTEVAATGKSSRMPMASPAMSAPSSQIAGLAAPESSDIKRNDGMTRADRKVADPELRMVQGLPGRVASAMQGMTPSAPRPSFDREAAIAKATGEVSTMMANARATVSAPRTDVKAPPLPEPTQAVRNAAKMFAKREADRAYKGKPFAQGEYKPTSFIDSPEYKAAQSAPAPQIAARPPSSRVGRDAPAPPTVDSMVQKVMGKPRTPTEFTEVTRTGGRAGATKRVAATPSPVRAAASKALASR